VWVAGEVNRVRQSQRGHLYFELIEKGDADEIVGKLEAVAWRIDFQRIRRQLADAGQEVAEGQTIRCRGAVDFYPPFGRLQFVVREIDPVFTAGLLARRRQETLEALAARGLLDRNRSLELSPVPQRLALITSHGSAAYHDFLSSLRESGYGFQVLFVHASVQGKDAEREVAGALQAVASTGVDCSVLIRGGGSRADLAVFDSRQIAEAIALAPMPVLTGLGHEIDRSIADMTAHTALKTPTKVAEFLVERLAASERRLIELREALCRRSDDSLRRGRETLGRAERGLALSRYRLIAAGSQLAQLATLLPRAAGQVLQEHRGYLEALRKRLVSQAPRSLTAARRAPGLAVERIVARAQSRLREQRATLEGWRRLCRQLAPERTLERGFSVTRDSAGRVLRDPAGVSVGERIVSELAGGRLASRVEER
jgi:exodeoxyribonuclease VII large subunit